MPINLLTTREAAERLRISTVALLKMAHEGRIPHLLFGKRAFRFREPDIEGILTGTVPFVR